MQYSQDFFLYFFREYPPLKHAHIYLVFNILHILRIPIHFYNKLKNMFLLTDYYHILLYIENPKACPLRPIITNTTSISVLEHFS